MYAGMYEIVVFWFYVVQLNELTIYDEFLLCRIGKSNNLEYKLLIVLIGHSSLT